MWVAVALKPARRQQQSSRAAAAVTGRTHARATTLTCFLFFSSAVRGSLPMRIELSRMGSRAPSTVLTSTMCWHSETPFQTRSLPSNRVTGPRYSCACAREKRGGEGERGGGGRGGRGRRRREGGKQEEEGEGEEEEEEEEEEEGEEEEEKDGRKLTVISSHLSRIPAWSAASLTSSSSISFSSLDLIFRIFLTVFSTPVPSGRFGSIFN